MDNIRAKKESLYDWRSELKESSECQCEGCDQDPCVECGENCHDVNEGVKTVIGLGLLAAPYLLKKFVKPKVDKKIEDARDNLKIGGNKRSGTTSEEVQGGVNVENYADGVQFNEIETVDIIKPEPLNASNWRNDLIQVDERYKFIGPGKGRKAKDEDMTKHKGEKTGANYLIPQASINNNKEVVSASNEIEGELVDEGLVRGAVQGAGLLWRVGKWAIPKIPKVVKALKNKGAADITKFKKSQEVVRRVNNIADIRATKSLKGADVKGVFTKSKVKPELNKVNWKSTVPTKSTNVSTTATKALKGTKDKVKPELNKVNWKSTVPTKSTNVSTTATKALKGTKDKFTKGMTPSQIRHDGMNVLAKIQGKTPTQIKAKEILSRMKNAIDKSKKGTTYSGKVDAAKKLPDPQSAVVKRGSTSVTTTELPVSKTTVVSSPKANLSKVKSLKKPQTIDIKASPVGKGSKATQSKIEGAKKWTEYNKRASVPSDVVTGNPNPPKFTGGKGSLKKGSLKPKVTVSKDKLLGKVATGVSGAAGLTAGVKVGQKVAKGGSSTPPPNENKTIPDTEKKTVAPEKNPEVTLERQRRDERLRKAKLKNNPRLQGLEKMKTGTPINQLFNKK